MITPRIDVGDIVRHVQHGSYYEVVGLTPVNGVPHAVIYPIPPGSGPEVPCALDKLELASKGGVQ